MSRHGSTLRQAAVAQWEVRFRAGGGAPAWRVVGSSPTGEGLPAMWWSHSPQVRSLGYQQQLCSSMSLKAVTPAAG